MAKKLLALLLAMCMVLSVCSVSVLAEEVAGGDETSTIEENNSADSAENEGAENEGTGNEGTENEGTENEGTENEGTENEGTGNEGTENEGTENEGTENEGTENEDNKNEDNKNEGTENEDNKNEGNKNEDEEVEKTANISLANSYLPNATITIKGTVTGAVSVVDVEILCSDDKVEEKETISVSKFKSSGIVYKLDDATVGAEYEVNIYDNDTGEVIGTDSFIIKKGTSVSDNEDDGSNKVTIWIEGTSDRYIDETVVNLNVLKEATVFDLAEHVLDEADRKYKDNKEKITAIASTETGSTYTLKDGATSTYLKDCTWNFFLNGVAYYEDDWTDVEINGGDQVILYFGEPGEVGYPVVKVTPNDIGVNDTVKVTVESQITDPKTGKVTSEPIKGAKVYIMKRGATSKGSGKSTDKDGTYSVKATSSWIKSYQGGEVMVAYYQSSTKPLKMVSVKKDLDTDRDGSIQAYVRIEGAHKTLLERTKSPKVEEYDLYNFMIEVLEEEDIEYEVNDDETNFTYFESKTTSGYANENGDITRDSGWYVVVNDVIYTPDDDLEEVYIYADDEILFYFGDEDTVPIVYHKVDGELETEERVYVYFYSDAELTEPIDDFDVYFDGDEYSDKRLNTNSDGRITLPSVEYKGTYTLYWGEQVGVKADECPTAVYGSVELKFTGTSKPTTSTTNKNDDDDDDDKNSDDEDRNWVEVGDDDWATKPDDDKDVSDWEDGDYEVPTEKEDFVPGPSKYYPDPNIDAWAVANVNKAHEYELMQGTALGWFEPQREITRAEFTAIICRILGLDTDADFDEKFGDVTSSDWHFGYVMAAYEAGYVNGMSEISFAPNNYITREEIAVMVSRILNVTGAEADVYKFADGTSVSAWARIYVAAVNNTGIMTGDQFGQFLPKSQVNRQTVATIAVRLYEYLGNN